MKAEPGNSADAPIGELLVQLSTQTSGDPFALNTFHQISTAVENYTRALMTRELPL